MLFSCVSFLFMFFLIIYKASKLVQSFYKKSSLPQNKGDIIHPQPARL